MATTRAKRGTHACNGAATSTRHPQLPGQIVLVPQGGGALRAYQVGVYGHARSEASNRTGSSARRSV